ncbi:MAG: ABC transporter permease [Chloroflexi bacterium]|nr:ABC transporter permease [Chloroflexota bacterium]MBV9133495.1 ABC transporter permease [Chloroflexota bacterium]
MQRFLARRVALVVLTLWLVSLGVFAVSELLPGDVAIFILGQQATPETLAVLRAHLGLNEPAPERYVNWLFGFIRGDWGNSLALQVPITDLVLPRMANSFVLAGLALLITVPASIGLGLVAALNQGRAIDRIISLVGLSGLALPEFVSGVLLILLFSLSLRVAPASAQIPTGASPLSVLPALILPALTLALTLFAYISRMTRASAAEVLTSDYVRAAVLKGLPLVHVITRHVLRNALLPTITVIGAQIGWLVGGLVVVEHLFGYPGLGDLLLFAALNKDIPLLEACVMVVASVYMLANLGTELLFGVLNPRIRYA